MRKTVILLIAASLLLAGACSKVPEGERRVPAASDVPVAFALGGQPTKALAPITTLAALAAQDFSVSAWYSPEGEIFDGVHSVKYFANHRFGYVTSDLAGETTFPNAWQGVAPHAATGLVNANPVYWPLDGTLSFFCYAPYREGDADIVLEDPVTDDGVVARLPDYLPGSPLIRVTPPATAADQADFLCAPPLLDRSRTDEGGAFPLDFSKHRMTQVEFGFNYTGTLVNDDVLNIHEQVRVTSVEIQDVIGSRYFYFTKSSLPADCAWSALVSPSDPSGADFPKASYRISSAGGELKTGLDANLPEQGSGTYLIVRKEDNLDGLFFLLPQTIPAGAKLVVSYNIVDDYAGVRGSEVITVPLCSDPPTEYPTLSVWPEGKKVRYLVTLDIPYRGFVAMTAKYYDWEDSNNLHPGQELMY